MNGAGTASASTASKLGATQRKIIAKHPQQRRIVIDVYHVSLLIDCELIGWHSRASQASSDAFILHDFSEE